MGKEEVKIMSLFEKMTAIQNELKAPKNQYNSFGKYKYRNQEDILEAVKPLLKKYGLTMILNDEIVQCENRYYIKASVTIHDGTSTVKNHALAREEETKKGMDASQITGTASSYARKYALNGMFLIDDTKDADTDEHKIQNDEVSKKTSKTQEKQSALDQEKQLMEEMGKMTTLTRDLSLVGVDVRQKEFSDYVDNIVEINDHRNAQKSLDDFKKVNKVYEAVLRKKKKEQEKEPYTQID